MEKIIAYKMFNKDLTCRDFQYEVGKTYKHEGEIDLCISGFHACENPLDCWKYYGITDSKFALVELSGDTDNHDDDSKIAAAEIHIKAELTLPEFIKKGVDCLLSLAKSNNRVQAASGNYSQLAASGNYSKLAASGNYSQLAASGNYSQLAASGKYSQLAASGDYSKLAASGNYSQLAASGNYSQLAASGKYSQLAASGGDSQLAASGDYSKLAASGKYSQLAASGKYSQLAASGGDSQLAASGDCSVIASSSFNSRAKGVIGTWISLAEFDEKHKCIGFATGKIGEDGLEPDTWYIAKDGKLQAR